MSGRFSIEQGTCYASEVRDIHLREQEKSGGAAPGQVIYTIPEEPVDPGASAIAHTIPDWVKLG